MINYTKGRTGKTRRPFVNLGQILKTTLKSALQPIGVFDSGLGGLTIVREMRKVLPAESIIYFGDMARLPYGTKSKEQIQTYSVQNTLFLIKHKVKSVVIACNSSSSAAYQFIRSHFNLPVIDVIEPAVQGAIESTRSGRVGVIATSATVASGAYEKGLLRRRPGVKVFQAACPLFVSLVEEGWLTGRVTRDIAKIYLKPLLAKKIDTLILGCTHYPMLRESIQAVVGNKIRLVDSISPTVLRLRQTLRQKGLVRPESSSKGELRIFVSDKPGNFVRLGEKFLGEKLNRVEVVRQK